MRRPLCVFCAGMLGVELVCAFLPQTELFVPFAAFFVAVCLLFFAFSTILSWNLFGKINANYLFGRRNSKLCSVIYTMIALVFIFLGTVSGSDFVWELTDMFNNLIVLPNVIALFALTGMVLASLNEVKKDRLEA